MEKTTKRYYFFWLLIPAAFFFFFTLSKKLATTPVETTFCTSVKATRDINIDLYKGSKILVSLNGANNKFSLVNYIGDITSPDSFSIHIKGANTNDTISFMAINFFINSHLYTLSNNQFSSLKISPNVSINNSSPNLTLIVNNGGDIWINFSHLIKWQNDSIVKFKWLVILLIFILSFVALLLIKPAARFLYLATIIAVPAMAFFWWVGQDSVSEIKLKNVKPIYDLHFYYNNIPSFTPANQLAFDGPNINRATQIYINKYPFLRISFSEQTERIDDLSFKILSGLFSKSWQLRSIPLNAIIGNDINYNAKTATYSINGHDPYLSFISIPLYSTILKLFFLRQIAFLIITILIFNGILIAAPLFAGVNTAHTALLVSFIIILFSSLTYLPFNSHRMYMDVEKRGAIKFPVLGKSPLDTFAKTLEKFINDQMPGRGELITFNNYSRHKIFGSISGNPRVYFGKNGWMFYLGDGTDEIYENKHPLTDEQLKTIRDLLVSRNEWLKKQNIRYYIVFPRITQFIYPEEIGDGLHVYNSPPKLVQLMNYLKKTTDLKIIDMYVPMIEAKYKYKKDLYYRVDIHWNLFGAYFAYKTIIDTIRKDFPKISPTIPLDSIKWLETYDNDGDMAKLLSLNNAIQRHQYIPLNSRVNDYKLVTTPTYSLKCKCLYPSLFYQSYDSTMPKLIMFRDSYSNFLMPYFSSHFSKQGYIWTPLFIPEIIEKEKPDIVITEMLERFIYNLLDENPTLPPLNDSTAIAVNHLTTQAKK